MTSYIFHLAVGIVHGGNSQKELLDAVKYTLHKYGRQNTL